MFKVFVSYSTVDLEWARYLKHLLSDAQAYVFVAEYDVVPGEHLSTKIIDEINACDLFILLWSRHSHASSYVHSEVFHAKAQGRTILPLLLQTGLRLPDFLSDVKYLPLEQNPETALEWLQSHVVQSASQKASSDLVAVALMAFAGWALLKSD
jgi:hypothetical protein